MAQELQAVFLLQQECSRKSELLQEQMKVRPLISPDARRITKGLSQLLPEKLSHLCGTVCYLHPPERQRTDLTTIHRAWRRNLKESPLSLRVRI